MMYLAIWSSLLISVLASSDITIETIKPQKIEPMTLQLNDTYQAVIIYKNISELKTIQPFRIRTTSNTANAGFPILVVVEQIKQVVAWPVPLIIETDLGDEIVEFRTVSKTLCHDDQTRISSGTQIYIIHPLYQSFIINLSTSSSKNVDVTVELEKEQDFYIKLNQNYETTISPSEPRYFFFRFTNDTVDTVVIEVNSDDAICLTVSVQDSKCPVLDMEKDIKYEGLYLTMNNKGAITISKRNYPSGFFLVFVAKTDNYDCSQDSSIIPRNSRTVSLMTTNITSKINFVVRNSISAMEYLKAMVGTLAILIAAWIVLLVVSLLFSRYGTVSNYQPEEVIISDYYEKLSEEKVDQLLKTAKPTVSQFSKHPKRINKRSYNYVYHTVSVAVFYSIPVVQLVVTYQRIVNQTGNEDMCYYNFLCSHPFGALSDFNHIYSNIGYILFGMLFILVAMIRHSKIKFRKDKGIPVHNGLHYAMGTALIIEGILSGCYHVCPSQSNYQFDTSFMYIMAGLCMIKLYQNRHPEINATAYTTFTILGAAIFMAMIGILNGDLPIWIIFVICYSALVVAISLKIYFMNYVLSGLNQVKKMIKQKGFCGDAFLPIRKVRFVILVIANIANYSFLFAGLLLYSSSVTDFGTFLLGLLMGNALIHCLFYTAMKIVVKETICKEAIFYGLLSLAFWAASGVFFLDAATLWTVSPAESRKWNQECIVAKFYDKHDIWHLLSAPALYLTFMYLLHLDDDILEKPQDELIVF